MTPSSHTSKKWLSPGSLIFTGQRKTESFKITLIEFNQTHFSEKKIDDPSQLTESTDGKVRWINISGLHEISVIEKIGEIFKLHPLLLEDVLNIDHIPKLDNFDDNLFVIAKMVDLNPIGGLNIEQISLVLTNNTLITFQEDEQDVFEGIRKRLRENIGRIRKSGVDYLMYRLLDSIVDGYLVVSESIENRIEALEDKVILQPDMLSIETIHKLRKEVVCFRRAVNPLRDVVYAMHRERDRHITKATDFFIRDLYDHLQHTLESIDVFREDINGLLDLHLSGSSRKLNEVIKVLTIISTIFIPLTFIVGIYGMNFNTAISKWNMPELDWKYGYIFVMVIMFAIALSLVAFFKRKKWF